MNKNTKNINEATFLQKQFKYFDIQNQGKVNFDQFYRAVEKAGVTMERSVSTSFIVFLIYLISQDVYTVFKAFDADGNGFLDYEEFSSVFCNGKSAQVNATKVKNLQESDAYLRDKNHREQIANKLKKDDPQSLLALFKDKLKARGPRGMIGLQRMFQIMDDDKSQTLSLPEFTKACKDFKSGISEENVPILFKLFDKNNDGTISYDEFLGAVRKPLTRKRQILLKETFEVIDINSNGTLTLDEIKKSYNASKHPDVIQGKKTEANVFNEFLETFEAHHRIVNENYTHDDVEMDEFIEYYENVSFAIDDDKEFEMMLQNTWNLKTLN